jgi:agmatinase
MPQRETVHYYAGPSTFFRAPASAPEELPEGSTAVLGVPLDSWSIGRNGQRHAPRAIRDASLWLAGYYAMQVEPEGYVDVESGGVRTVPDEPRLFDIGDVQLPQTDPAAATRRIAASVAQIVARGAMPVVLGGDHYVPYPSFVGFVDGLRERKENARVGFLNIDGHFDFWDEVTDMGRHNHGTFARRISEHPAVGRMAWWGLTNGNVIDPAGLRALREGGHSAYTADSARRRGLRTTMREALEIVSEDADAVYVTFDIDVTDGGFAPGTHSIAVDGLSSGEVLEAVGVLSEFDTVRAFDVCELIPQYDVGGGRTARYASHVIMSVIGDRVLDTAPMFDRGDLDAVFR